MTLQIPAGTKIYKTLARACKYTYTRPAGVQPVFDAATRNCVGFAALPEKKDGAYVFWTR